jgi:streptogramin lyase
MRRPLALLAAALALASCGGSAVAERPCEPPGDRVDIPDGTGRIGVGGYANLLTVGEGSVWVLVAGPRRTVVRIDAHDGRVRRYPFTGSEEARLAAGHGALWLADPQSGAVTRLDATSGRSTVHRPLHAREITIGPDGPWVAAAEGGRVARLDPGSGTVRERHRLRVDEIADLDAGDGTLWVTTGEDGRVLRVPGGATRVGATALDVEAAGGHAWVDLGDADTLVRMQADGSVARRVANGGNAFAIAVAHGSVWASNYGLGTVTRIDEETGRRVGRPIGVGRDVKGVAAGEGAVWVANAGECTISRLAP